MTSLEAAAEAVENEIMGYTREDGAYVQGAVNFRDDEVTDAPRIARVAGEALLDVEQLARNLFVIDSDQPLAFALRIWDEARDDSPVKRLFRTHAMKLRTMTLGIT